MKSSLLFGSLAAVPSTISAAKIGSPIAETKTVSLFKTKTNNIMTLGGSHVTLDHPKSTRTSATVSSSATLPSSTSTPATWSTSYIFPSPPPVSSTVTIQSPVTTPTTTFVILPPSGRPIPTVSASSPTIPSSTTPSNSATTSTAWYLFPYPDGPWYILPPGPVGSTSVVLPPPGRKIPTMATSYVLSTTSDSPTTTFYIKTRRPKATPTV